MAKLTEELIKDTFQPHLQEGEEVQHVAFGVKQPNIFLLIALIACAILPGIIAVFLLTKNYVIGLTNRRFIVLRIKSMTSAEVREITEYALEEVRAMEVKTSTGGLFTHIEVKDDEKPFKAKFHRAFAKFNRPSAMAIAEAIS